MRLHVSDLPVDLWVRNVTRKIPKCYLALMVKLLLRMKSLYLEKGFC
jgi:hypothetical protein